MRCKVVIRQVTMTEAHDRMTALGEIARQILANKALSTGYPEMIHDSRVSTNGKVAKSTLSKTEKGANQGAPNF